MQSPSTAEQDSALAIMKEPRLCRRCQQLNIDRMFDSVGRIRSDGQSLAALGTISQGMSRSKCPLCKLFAIARFSPYKKRKVKDWELRGFSCLTAYGMKLTKQRLAKNPRMLLCVVPKGCGKRFRPLRARGSRVIVPLVGNPPVEHRTYEFLGHVIHPYVQEYDRFRSWLEKCDHFHGGKCSAPKAVGISLMRLSVIDCYSNKIVQIGAREKYFTLSYVCGKASSDIPSHQELNSNLSKYTSKVVQDAMEVCRRLGGQYLWVDKYCIAPQDKDIAIRSMDQIYEGAYATIIATGPDADCGIPGVSIARELLQPHVKTCGATVALTTHIDLYQGVNQTVWNTRGWTYQEAVLSRRKLVFTPQKVYFQCHHGSACEDVYSSLDVGPLKVTAHYQEIFQPLLSNTKDWVFPKHLNQYTGRNLTKGSDILDAFRGILNRSKDQSYWGVPLIGNGDLDPADPQRAHRAFALGLCWAHTYQSGDSGIFSRRPGFPSWSWTGWHGRKDYRLACVMVPSVLFGLNPTFGITSDIRFWIISEPPKAEGSLSDACAAAPSTAVIEEQSQFLRVEGTVIKVSFDAYPNLEGDHLRYAAKPSSSETQRVFRCHESSKSMVDFVAWNENRRNFAQQYFSKAQEGLLLFQSRRVELGTDFVQPDTCVLLLRHKKYHSERVGVVWIYHSELHEYSPRRKELILG